MNPTDYHAFTDCIVAALSADPAVLGVVALGSMSAEAVQPDVFSDHDFFVVTVPGAQHRFRQHYDWLPDPERIVLYVVETDHGVKVLYDDGHLLEYAVFDLEELHLARVNRFRVLLDRADITSHLRAIAARTAVEKARQSPSDEWLLGMFIGNLQVGVGRYLRGEHRSGDRFVRGHALGHLLALLDRHATPAGDASLLDNLDPTRRFEQVFPALGRELDAVLAQPVPQAAPALLALAERELAGPLREVWPADAVTALRQWINRHSTRTVSKTT